MSSFKKLVFLSLIVLLPQTVLAAMSSTNYFIYADSLDYGGDLSTSTSNNLQDSVGSEAAIGYGTSTSYEVKAGYQGIEVGTLTLSLGSSSVSLGTLSTAGVVVTSSVLATVNTNSETGYTLSISSVSGSSLTAVSDGAVDGVGSTEEYGLALSGTHRAFVTDAAVVSSLALASYNSSVSDDATTLIFKAIRSSGTAANTYSQDLVLTAAVN